MLAERIAHDQPHERPRLYTVYAAARALGWTEGALRSAIFRGHVRSQRIGARVFITVDELDRLTGR